MSKLYELTNQFRELNSMDAEDENMAIAIRDTLEGIEAEFKDKAIAVTYVARNIDTDIEVLKTEIARLQARKKALENSRDGLKDYLRHNMEATGIKSISCPLFTISFINARDKVIVDNPDKIPDKYVVIERRPKLLDLMKAIKKHGPIEGARIEKGKPGIRIY